MTLWFAVLLTMVIIRFRSLQIKTHISAHQQAGERGKGEGEGEDSLPHKKQQQQSTHAKA